jgi:hypothetical protein
MLTNTQRLSILKWTSGGLLIVSLLPVLAHRLFFFSILQSYLIAIVIAGLTYYGYKKSKEIWEW